MKPWQTVEKALAPDGTEMVLVRRDDEWVVRYDGKVLTSSRQHGSEDALASLALARVKQRRSVLVGGLGLGFTLRAALDRLPVDAKLVVAELTPALLDWNRRLVGKLAGRPLDDPRTHVHVGDAVKRIQEAKGAYDAILLDIDNGPGSVVHESNHRLYGLGGIALCRDALRDGGCLAVWSAHHDERYLERLQRSGFEAEAKIVPSRGELGGLKHIIFLAVKNDAARPGARHARGQRAAGGGRPVEHPRRSGAPPFDPLLSPPPQPQEQPREVVRGDGEAHAGHRPALAHRQDHGHHRRGDEQRAEEPPARRSRRARTRGAGAPSRPGHR